VTTFVGNPVGTNALPVVPVHVVDACPVGKRSMAGKTRNESRRMILLVANITSRSSRSPYFLSKWNLNLRYILALSLPKKE
jgi:hypothetical protein